MPGFGDTSLDAIPSVAQPAAVPSLGIRGFASLAFCLAAGGLVATRRSGQNSDLQAQLTP